MKVKVSKNGSEQEEKYLVAHRLINTAIVSVSQQAGRDPLLGHQNLCYITIIVINGSQKLCIILFCG